MSKSSLTEMLNRHASVYLKPSGGSIGHGMVRIDRMPDQHFQIAVLKNGETRLFQGKDLDSTWDVVVAHRLSGPYVIQSAKDLLRWQHRPCDFRVLLQKREKRWQVIGVGVRVAGEGVITTHVPNGGSIVAPLDVLESHFGSRASVVERNLRYAALLSAVAIDKHYEQALGEMSMDMAIEDSGRIWFLEANSKPMKFDEKPIRRRSLEGVLLHLNELRRETETKQISYSSV